MSHLPPLEYPEVRAMSAIVSEAIDDIHYGWPRTSPGHIRIALYVDPPDRTYWVLCVHSALRDAATMLPAPNIVAHSSNPFRVLFCWSWPVDRQRLGRIEISVMAYGMRIARPRQNRVLVVRPAGTTGYAQCAKLCEFDDGEGPDFRCFRGWHHVVPRDAPAPDAAEPEDEQAPFSLDIDAFCA